MKKLLFIFLFAFASFSAFAQTTASTGKITGFVKDPNQAVLASTQVVLTNSQTKVKTTAVTDSQGIYAFKALQPGSYIVEVDSRGFKPSVSAEIKLAPGQNANSDFALALAGNTETVDVSGTVENAYRVDNVKPGGPLGEVPIVNLPYSVNVISRQLIDDTQSRNFKQAAKYLPLIGFQEMQGPEVLRPESRGMQGSNMQNDRKDGMGIAVTTPSALEEYEQLEVINGLGGPMYGPGNPSGMFNFVTKRPTDEPLRQIEMDYEGKAVGTVHADFGGRFGPNKMFGYRTNMVMGDGLGYVSNSQLRRQLGAIALDVHPFAHTVVEGNFSYYNLYQHGYPGWFSYNPTTTPTKSSPYTMLPVNAPNPTLRGYGQSFSGVDLNNQITEVRVKQDFSPNWQLIIGGLNQLADRNINTAVNSFVNTGAAGTAAQYLAHPGNYQSYIANAFSSLAPRFQVKSDLGYLTGKFKTWSVGHDVVIGSDGYRFASWSPVSPLTKAQGLMCPPGTTAKTCATTYINISDPLVLNEPAVGIPSYSSTGVFKGIYVSSIIHQQGIVLADTVTLTPRWMLRVAASQDWTWTNSYASSTAPSTGYMNQGVSPTASLMFKPAPNQTIYGTFASSIQAPDVVPASTATNIIVNANQVLPQYRSKEEEVGYKLALPKINFSTAIFRLERPFAELVTAPAGACGTLKPGQTCSIDEIVGDQLNYGAEAMLSGRIIDSLMVTGGITALNPKLTNTGVAATNDKNFVGIPDWKSNILAEYRLPVVTGLFLNFNWQHVGRRAVDDVNSTFTPQYNVFDLGVRYTARMAGKPTTWRVTVNNISNVHYWSTLGPGSITGAGTSANLAHLGEPLLVTASMRYEF